MNIGDTEAASVLRGNLKIDDKGVVGIRDQRGNSLFMERKGSKWGVTIEGKWRLTFNQRPRFDALLSKEKANGA